MYGSSTTAGSATCWRGARHREDAAAALRARLGDGTHRRPDVVGPAAVAPVRDRARPARVRARRCARPGAPQAWSRPRSSRSSRTRCSTPPRRAPTPSWRSWPGSRRSACSAPSTPAAAGGGPRTCSPCSAVAYTHYIGIFVLAAQAGWAFWVHRDRLRRAGHRARARSCSPTSRGSPRTSSSRVTARTRPAASRSSPRRRSRYFARANAQVVFGQPFATLRDVPGRAAAVLAVLVLAAALVAAGVRAWRRDPPGARMVLVILLALATPLGIAALSLPGRPQLPAAAQPDRVAAGARRPVGWLLVALRSRLAVAAAAAFLLVLAVGAAHALDPRATGGRPTATRRTSSTHGRGRAIPSSSATSSR